MVSASPRLPWPSWLVLALRDGARAEEGLAGFIFPELDLKCNKGVQMKPAARKHGPRISFLPLRFVVPALPFTQ